MLVHSQISETNKNAWLPYPESQQQFHSSISTSLPIIDNSINRKQVAPNFGSGNHLPLSSSSTQKTGRPQSENGFDKNNFLTLSSPSSSNNLLELKRSSGAGSAEHSLYDNQYLPTKNGNRPTLQPEVEQMTDMEKECQKKSWRIEELVKENIELFMERKKAVEEASEKSSEVVRLQVMLGKLTDKSQRHHFITPTRSPELTLERQEGEKIRKDLQTSNHLVTGLQKDLIGRDATIKKLTTENERLKENISEKDVSISSLMRKLTQLNEVQQQIQDEEKEKSDQSRELNHLNQKLTTAERSIQTKEEEIQYLTNMVDELQVLDRKKCETVRDLSSKLLETKTLIGDLQLADGVLRVEVQETENKYKRFLGQIMHVTLAISESEEPHIARDEKKLIQVISELVNYKLDCEERLRKEDADIYKLKTVIDGFEMFSKQLNESLCPDPKERTSARTRVYLESLKSIPCNDYTGSMKELLTRHIANDLQFLEYLESVISNIIEENGNLSILKGVEKLKDRYMDLLKNKSNLEHQLELIADVHNKEIQRIRREHEDEMRLRMSDEMERESCRKKASKSEKELREGIVVDYESKLREYQATIDSLQKEDYDKELRHKHDVDYLTEKIMRLGDVQEQLDRAIESREILAQSMSEVDYANKRLQVEVDTLKEEMIKDNATIKSLKNQILLLTKENKSIDHQLTESLTKKRKEIKKNDGISEESPNKKKFELFDLERRLSILRDENILLKNKNRDNEEIINGLMMTHHTDSSTELSTKEDENGNYRSNGSSHNPIVELEDIKSQQLQELLVEVDELNKKLQEKTRENEHLIKKILSDKESEMEPQSGQCSCGKYTKLSSEFVTLGAQCRGDRHVEVIESQKIALGELRRKMKKLDMGRFQEPNSQRLTQQISKLMKDIAELKANEALKENLSKGVRSIADILRDRNAAKERHITEPSEFQNLESLKAEVAEITKINGEIQRENKKLSFDLEIEKAAYLDLQQSFQLSETSYFHLVRQLSTALNFEAGKIPETFGNWQSREKANLQIKRGEVCENIVQRIEILKEMLERRNELLQTYERDLVKLKQSEDLSATAQLQMEEMVQQTRKKVDEVDLLRETLSRTKDLLNYERRQNISIKNNNYYQPYTNVIQSRSISDGGKHHCVTEDVNQEETRKRQSEIIRRKDYELQCLKLELSNKDKALVQATDRVRSIETTLGIECEISMT